MRPCALATRAPRGRAIAFALAALVALALLGVPGFAQAAHNARLLQLGAKGLYSYNVWTGQRSLLIAGMKPAGTPFEHPYLSPGRKAVVTMGCSRSDRAYASSMKISCYPTGTPFAVASGVMCVLSGWTDQYHAVVWIGEETYKVDARTGKKVGNTGSGTYAAAFPKTAGDRLYKVTVSGNKATVRVRKTGKKIASFRVPGVGGASDWWSDPSAHAVSPDGSHIVFEDMATPHHDSRVSWALWTCTLDGTHATKLKLGSGGFLWR